MYVVLRSNGALFKEHYQIFLFPENHFSIHDFFWSQKQQYFFVLYSQFEDILIYDVLS